LHTQVEKLFLQSQPRLQTSETAVWQEHCLHDHGTC